MMKMRYYAVRYTRAPDQVRIQHAATPESAFRMAFGHKPRLLNVGPTGCEFKDLGGSVAVLRSDRKRIALLTSPDGWEVFP